MADDEKNEAESAGTPESTPADKPVKKPESAPLLPRDERPFMEQAHWTLATLYYGAHIAEWMWLQAQQQLFSLVQPYL